MLPIQGLMMLSSQRSEDRMGHKGTAYGMGAIQTGFRLWDMWELPEHEEMGDVWGMGTRAACRVGAHRGKGGAHVILNGPRTAQC